MMMTNNNPVSQEHAEFVVVVVVRSIQFRRHSQNASHENNDVTGDER
jgi:hypothetical protein